MGSMIHLAVGKLEIDWGKNYGFADHSPLFQVTDVTEVPYYYADEDAPESEHLEGRDWAIKVEYKEGLSKPLNQVADRINLLGYTMHYAETEFKYLAEYHEINLDQFPFKKLADALANVDVQKLSLDYDSQDYDYGEFFRREIYPRLGFSKTEGDSDYDLFNGCFGIEQLSAYSILQLLSTNPQARELPVQWAFDDLAENGWAKRSAFVRKLEPKNKFLIVTEGSSDVAIIKHAFSLLKPHIADFFDFVDMEEGYPFTGTGNLVNFVKGLISISVQNNVIVVFDNDAEGVASLQKCAALNVPENMRIIKLPDMPGFANFKTIGPDGGFISNINGAGAAIECYLDTKNTGTVRWKAYNNRVNIYQGELIGKDDYKREFLRQRQIDSGYDYSRISAVLELIVATAISMREISRIKELNDEIYDPER